MSRWGTVAILGPLLALGLWFALLRHGIHWPDEIFQSLEPAHRLAFGYGFQSWEYQLGARSWIFPAVLAGVLKAAAFVGPAGPETVVISARIFMVLVGVAGVYASLRLARALGGAAAGALAALLVACFPIHLVLAGRAMSEVASATLLTFAAWLIVEPTPTAGPARLRLAGALAALATLLRTGNVIVAAGLLVLLLLRRPARPSRHYLEGALLTAALLGGVLDWITWGAPFHSTWLHLRYNLLEGRAADYGVAPLAFYLQALWTSTGPVLLVVLAGLARVPAGARGLALVALVYLLVHSFLPHKELRFLLPVTPLVLSLSACGLSRWVSSIVERVAPTERRSRWLQPAALVAALAAALGLLLTLRAPQLTYGDLGWRGPDRQSRVLAGSANDGFNRLLFQAHRREDLCGLAVAGASLIWTGGYSYFHRDLPLFELLQPTPAGSPSANYLLAPSAWSAPPAATAVARQGEAVLYRYERRCAPPPSDYRLFELPAMGRR